MGTITWVSCCLVVIANVGLCIVTDKDYALLPPVFELDNYDRCMLLEDEALYCTIEFRLKHDRSMSESKIWRQIQELNADRRNYHHDVLRHGVCIPITCPNISVPYTDPTFAYELSKCYNKKYEHLNNIGIFGSVETMNCQTNEPKEFSTYTKLVIILLVSYILFIFYASFYEGLARYGPPEDYKAKMETTYGRIVSSFSIPKNWSRLKFVSETPETQSLRWVQGIRLYNLITVILAHVSMLFIFCGTSNTRYVEKVPNKFYTIFLASGPYCVGTFFVLSSLFLTYNSLKAFYGKKEIKMTLKHVFQIILQRYIRLTPQLALAICIQTSFMEHLGRGPWWELVIGIDRKLCKENGWTNLLYLNDIINRAGMCFVETWYLSVDMQAFVMICFILYFTVDKPERLKWVIPLLWLINLSIMWRQIIVRNIATAAPAYPEDLYLLRGLFNEEGVWLNYNAYPFIHFHSSLIGMVAGYILYMKGDKRIFTTKVRVFFWWILSFGFGFSIILLPGLWIMSDNFYPSPWFSVPYLCLSPTIFCIALVVGFVGFSEGVGWMAKWAVEWSPTYILGRLSYSGYLAHYMIVLYRAGNYDLFRLDEFTVFYELLAITSMSLFFGLIVTLILELPISALQGMLFRHKTTRSSERDEVKQKELDEGKQKTS